MVIDSALNSQHILCKKAMLHKKLSLTILLLLVSFATVSTILFVPALPKIANYFEVSADMAQLTISLFLLGYALGLLPYGSFADRFGRKPILYFGLTFAVFGSILCILSGFSKIFWLFLGARFVMALGACVGLKITFTLIGDYFQHRQAEAAKFTSSFPIAFAVAPGVAIFIGGFLTRYFDWISCFYFLGIYGIFLLILSFSLPETIGSKDLQALSFKSIKHHYLSVFKNPHVLLSSFILGCNTSIFYLFAARSPFIGIELIQLKPDQFGMLNLIPPLGLIIGAISSRKLLQQISPIGIIRLGSAILCSGILIMGLCFILGYINIWTLFLPMAVILMGNSLIYGNSTAIAMSYAHNKSNASAIMNFLNVGTGSIAIFISGFIFTESALAMPVFFAAFTLIIMLLVIKLHRTMQTEPSDRKNHL